MDDVDMMDEWIPFGITDDLLAAMPDLAAWDLGSPPQEESSMSEEDWEAESARLDRLADQVTEQYNALVKNHAFTAGGTYEVLRDRGLARDHLAHVEAGCQRLWTSLQTIYQHICADRVDAAALDLCTAERDWQQLHALVVEAGGALARAAPPAPIESRA